MGKESCRIINNIVINLFFLEPTMRVGDEFQAEVPEVIKGFYGLKLFFLVLVIDCSSRFSTHE